MSIRIPKTFFLDLEYTPASKGRRREEGGTDLKIGELAQKTGLSMDTLRYYEKIGLIAPPWRNAGKTRIYDPQTLVWITFLKALKATGMPLSDMQAYASLRSQGISTSAERRTMLEDQRERVKEQIATLQDCLCVLDHKISNYLEIEQAHAAADSVSPPRKVK
jgi:DNA-binding transcriptional MerR regulator